MSLLLPLRLTVLLLRVVSTRALQDDYDRSQDDGHRRQVSGPSPAAHFAPNPTLGSPPVRLEKHRYCIRALWRDGPNAAVGNDNGASVSGSRFAV